MLESLEPVQNAILAGFKNSLGFFHRFVPEVPYIKEFRDDTEANKALPLCMVKDDSLTFTPEPGRDVVCYRKGMWDIPMTFMFLDGVYTYASYMKQGGESAFISRCFAFTANECIITHLAVKMTDKGVSCNFDQFHWKKDEIFIGHHLNGLLQMPVDQLELVSEPSCSRWQCRITPNGCSSDQREQGDLVLPKNLAKNQVFSIIGVIRLEGFTEAIAEHGRLVQNIVTLGTPLQVQSLMAAAKKGIDGDGYPKDLENSGPVRGETFMKRYIVHT